MVILQKERSQYRLGKGKGHSRVETSEGENNALFFNLGGKDQHHYQTFPI